MTFDMMVQHFFNALMLGSLYGLIAIGYTMVYGILRLINFAHGDIFMISTYFVFLAITVMHLPWIPAVLLSILATAIFGVMIDRVAYQPLRNAPRLRAPGSGFSRPGTGTAQPVNEYHIKILR